MIRVATFDRFCIMMTLQQALDCSVPGQDAADAVAGLATDLDIMRQITAIEPRDIAAELREYGAWDDTELADETANITRILWIAAGNIRDEEQSPGG